MKSSQVVVNWPEGVHLRNAAALALTAQKFHSRLFLRCGGKVADLRSIISVITLCAAMGTALEIEASGDDEQEATRAIEQVFVSDSVGASDRAA